MRGSGTLAVFGAMLLGGTSLAAQSPPAPVSFAHQVRPILELRCYECHDANERESGFDLTTVKGLLAGGEKAGAAVVPGKPDASPILEYLSGVRHPRMPKNRKPLADGQIALIAAWIADGARDDSLGAGQTTDARETAQVPRLVASHDTAGVDARLSEALFSDVEQLFVLRREMRLARLPRPDSPALVDSTSDNPIDQFIAASWRAAKLPEADAPPPLVDDAGFIRRVTLDLIGVVPSPADTSAFLADTAAGKRAALIDQLLSRSADYAAHWTPFWEDALGSQNTKLLGGIPTRGNYRDWIFTQFRDNVPFDILVASLIDPTMPRNKPREAVTANGKVSYASYVLNNTPTDTIQSAANVAQVFMGTSMKCASCHNHFLNDEWPQARFLAFAGLFATADLELVRCERHTGQIVPARFPFALPEVPQETPDSLNGRLHRAALLLTDPTNPRFAKSIVNRLWRRYVGLGFVEPVDDFRLERVPSEGPLLEWLADDFMRHGYDLKHTIRLILTSRTYQRAYNPRLEDHFDVQKPDAPRYYRSPRLRRLTAEQFIDSVRLVANGTLNLRQRVYLNKESTALTRALGRPAARNEISTSRPEDTAVLQALELMNGPELSYLVYGGALNGTLRDRLGHARSADAAAVAQALYLAVLARTPSPAELKAFEQFVRGAPGTATKAAPAGESDQTVFDDTLPSGAVVDGSEGPGSWTWSDEHKPPSGARVVRQASAKPVVSHRVEGLTPVTVGERDRLTTWVYLDPAQPPTEIMIEWLTDDWNHRAFWTDSDKAPSGGDAPERRWLGPLPKTGQWVRLEVPAGEVDAASSTGITGWSFAQSGGTVYWSGAAIHRVPASPLDNVVGDALWAMVSGPEFQFIR